MSVRAKFCQLLLFFCTPRSLEIDMLFSCFILANIVNNLWPLYVILHILLECNHARCFTQGWLSWLIVPSHEDDGCLETFRGTYLSSPIPCCTAICSRHNMPPQITLDFWRTWPQKVHWHHVTCFISYSSSFHQMVP